MVGDAGEQVKRTDMTRDSKETMRHGERRKFTQTTRSLPARAAGARMRLVFALISVITLLATMFVTGPFQARVAEAAEAGICKPSTGTIGDGNGPKTDSDDGVATWVGRDMYVGAPNGDATHYDSNTKPMQSYAVEAEGLTAIKGKLISNAVKGTKGDDSVSHANFNGHGFRFGTVGFGANLRPTTGSDVLVIGGESDVTLSDAEGNSVNALAWGNAARGNVRSDNLGPGHRISIAGGWSKAHEIDQNDNYDDLERGDDINYNWVNEGSVFNFDDRWNRPSGTSSEVRWNVNDPLSNVRLNTNDDSKTTSVKGQQKNIENLSKVLKARPTTAQGVVSTAPEQNGFYRQNYGNANYRVTFNFGGEQSNTPKERLITFTGNGTNTGQIDSATGAYKVTGGSVMQVFTLDASLLDNAGTNGISFRFDNIPEYASVVINVVGDRQITFNNGWRFWWNGAEISNYYTVFNQDNKQARNELYSHAASAIMWNFADVTSKVTVRGGQITNGQNGWVENTRADGKHYSQNVGGEGQVQITDDPVANMLGSVLVPNGSFETHVSTNGRVWVGKDYMMYNPTGLEELAYLNGFQSNAWNQPISASVIEQDQERHNFGWHGEISDACAVLEWSKVDSDGNALAGTEWAIYASKEAAMQHDTTAALVTVLDDGHDDWAIGTNGQGAGKFQVRRLNPNATYYLREISAPAGYAVNSNIYQINTGNGNQTENDIDQVVDGGFIKPSTTITATFDSQGNSATNDLLWTTDESTYGKRVVNMELPSVEWEKVDSETGEPLGGSEWQIWHTPAGDNQVTQIIAKDSYALTDSVSTRIYFSPGTANWDKNSAFVSYLDNGGWKKVPFNADGLKNPNGMRVATVPMKGAAFTFKIGHSVNGIDEYYPNTQNGTEFQAPANEGHYVVASSMKQQAEIPACSMEYASKHDSDPREGRFKLIGLGQGEYMIHEHKVPAGHWDQVNGEKDHHLKFGFKVAEQNVNWVDTQFPHVSQQSGGSFETKPFDRVLPSSVKDGVGVIGNAPTEVSWWKIDADDKDSNGDVKNTVLAGSEWQLQKWDDTANPKAYVDLGSTITDSATTTVYFASTVSNLANLKYGFNVNSSEDKDWMAATVSDAPQSCNELKMATIPSEGKQFWLKVGDVTLEIAAGKGVVLVSTNESNNPVVASQIPACAVSGVQDLNPEPGKFTLKRLPVGKYRLRETKAPLGYVLPADEYIYFEVTKKASETNGVQWKQGWAGVDGSGNPTNLTQGNKAPINVNEVSDSESARAVGNTRKPGEVTWEKIAQKPQRQHKQGQVDDLDTPAALSEEENHQLLAGSEWKLEYTKYGAVQSDAKPTKTLTIKDCVKETKDGTESKTFCTVAENGLSGNDATTYRWAVDVEETAGKFKISGMPWGDYVLTESKAPDGYNLDATPHKFSIGVKTSEDGSTVVGTGGTVTDGNTTISIYLGEIENEPGVVLPVTGAEGRHLWPAIVGALFVLAAFGCAMALRMRE